ncbi:2-keto-4-pentenoate hydratase [Pseudomonas lini]
MAVDTNTIARAAQLLREAAETHQFITPLREAFPYLDVDAAYAIQRLNTELKVANGARIVGSKIGLTSLTVQKQLGVDTPDYGTLLDTMWYGEGLPIPMSAMHQPKVEAEVAFVLGRDLDMENPCLSDVLRAVEFAVPALEIVGSRIADWNIKLVDTVADNASSSAFVLGGSPKKLAKLELRACKMRMDCDGEVVSTGVGADCMGHPLNAVTWLARTMVRMGTPMRAGFVVLSGALGPMIAVEAGRGYAAHIDGLGCVSAFFDDL